MKLLLLLLIIIPCSLTAQNDIRNVNWGWSKDQVKKAEKLTLSSTLKDHLYYKGTLASTKFKIFYSFMQNKLTDVLYLHDEMYSNSNDYIRDFDILTKILTEKYGEPVSTYEKFSDDVFKETDRDKWGDALKDGYLTLISKWTSAKTKVSLMAYAKDYEISMSISYESVELQEFIKKYTKEKNDNDF